MIDPVHRLGARERLIEDAALQLALADFESGAAWIRKLGDRGRYGRQRTEWFGQVVAIRLYRERHDITGPAPPGNPQDVRGLSRAHEHRAASAALRNIRSSAQRDIPWASTDRSLDVHKGVSRRLRARVQARGPRRWLERERCRTSRVPMRSSRQRLWRR